MYQYIDTLEKLEAFLQQIHDSKWIALDTEFIREKTYFPKLCLIQLATENHLACIDPLKISDLSSFFTFLRRDNLIKVLHAAWQDIEILYHLSGEVLTPVFDTQIAAAVLGLGDQLGYARLVEELLGISLDKSQSRTDWAQRPLNERQVIYAIDDVRYLREIYPLLLQRLQHSERLSWVAKSFQQLSEATQYQPEPSTSWQRVKGLQILKPRQLAILRELAAWRETLAIEKDLPRRWIIADEILLDIARLKPTQLQAFAQIRGLNNEQITRYGTRWLELIQVALQLPPEEWPVLPRRKKLDAQLAVVADLLMVVVNHCALEYNISPQLLATRSQVEKMLTEGRQTLADDWRGSLVNDLFSGILQGRQSIRLNDQQLHIENSR